MTALLNLGTAVFPLMEAAIYNAANNLYVPYVEIFFAALAGIAFCLGLWLNFEDRLTGNELNRSHWFDNQKATDENTTAENSQRPSIDCIHTMTSPDASARMAVSLPRSRANSSVDGDRSRANSARHSINLTE
jgi:hypothetical protein